MNDLQKNLLNWAEETVKVYVDYANAHDDAPAFYTQSPLNGITQSPKVLIMGINPGSNGTYKEQKDKSKNWNFKGDDMSAEELLSGNFCKSAKDPNISVWNNFHETKYCQNLNKYLAKIDVNPITNPQDCIITNATFFATLQAKDIQNILPKTCMQTLKLIEVLSPKKVIILSGYRTARVMRGLINKCEDIDKPQITIRDFKAWDGCVYKCSKGSIKFVNKEIEYIGIPHPSYQKLSNEDMDKFATLIANFMAE